MRRIGIYLFIVSFLVAGANYRVKNSENYVRFNADGSFIAEEITEIEVLTEKGAKELTNRHIPYHKRYGSVKVLKAEIREKDGKVREVTREYIKDQTSTALQQMNIYEENFREILLTYPGLKPGDTIYSHILMEYKPLIKGHFNNEFLLQDFEPIDRIVLKIEGPAEKKLNYVVRNGRLSFHTERKGKNIIYVWEGKNIPALEHEVGAPSPLDYGLKLIVSTFKSWKELSNYGALLNRGKVDSNPEMRKKVEELIKGAKTEREKIQRIFHFVESKVRYMGSSMDVGAFVEPHKASYTFAKKFGVCRDKSILMIAMLKLAGVNAEDVVINISRKTDPEIPSLFFEHAIVAVKLSSGETVYMDPTLELSSEFGETYVGDRNVLHLVEGGKDLVKVPHVPAERSLLKIKAKSRITDKGELESDVLLQGEGFNDYILRTIASRAPGLALLLFYQRLASSLAPGAKIVNPLAGDPFDLAKKYKVSFRVTAKNYTTRAGKYLLFKIPMSKDSFDIYVSYVLKTVTPLEKRKYPLSLFSTAGSMVQEEISIPEGYKVFSLPRNVEVRKGPFYFRGEVLEEKNRIFFKRTLLVDSSYVTPHEYQLLKEVLGEMERFRKQMIILEEK